MHVQKYLIFLAQERLEFRIAELESIAELFSKQLTKIWDKTFLEERHQIQNGHNTSPNHLTEESHPYTETNTPYVVLENVDEADVKNFMSRLVSAKQAYEIWGHGNDYNSLKSSILAYPSELKQKYLCNSDSFCIRVKASGRKISLVEQVEKIECLENELPFAGSVDLKNPSREFHIIEDYGKSSGKKMLQPRYLYFGRLIADGQRSLISSYSVKTRKFIGNTSMESGLSFIMSNLAKVKMGDYVCDPFVGTGSLLIAAAHFGGFVTGGDINYNILHSQGKSSRVGAGYRQKDETIHNSLRQYGLGQKFVDVLVHDAARHPWSYRPRDANGLFDCIITDPPYGIREGCRKIGTQKKMAVDPLNFDVHHPERTSYHLNHVYSDLLTFAAFTLIPGGRLVYWIPIYKPEYSEDNIPSHPNLKLLYNCEQPLKRETSRRLIVMEKLDVGSPHTGVANTPMFQGHNAFRDKYFKISKSTMMQ